MHKQAVMLLTVVVLGLLLPAMPVTATSPQDDGVVIWNEDYTLTAGAELDGDLVVFNGDAILESRSRIKGNAVVWNGNADVNGAVEGNLVVSNGDIRLSGDALVEGDVVCSWNCAIEQEAGARIGGDIVEGPSLRGIPFGHWSAPGFRILIPVPERRPFWTSAPEQLLRWFFRAVRGMVTVLVITALGAVVSLIWPRATTRVGLTAFQSPGASLGVGCLTLVAGTALIIALAITICLSPAAVLLALGLGAAGLFGWLAIGARVGRRLLEQLHAGEIEPLWVASVGTLIITLISLGLSAAFCLAPLGWLVTLAISCFGLGAVVLTRFGTRRYLPGQGRQIAEPPPPPPPAEATREPPGPTMTENPPESPASGVEGGGAEGT